MAVPTTATLDFLVNRTGGPDTAAIATAIAPGAIPLPTELLTSVSARLTSDVAAVVGAQARRRVILDLTQPPFLSGSGNGVQPAEFRITVFSQSAADTAAGTGGAGLQVARFHYNDQAGAGHTEDIPLAGKTPVVSANVNYFRMTDITPVTVGSLGGNKGLIVVRGPAPVLIGGGPAGKIPLVSGQGGVLVIPPNIARVPASFYSLYGNSAPPGVLSQLQPLRRWLTNAIQAVIGPIITVNAVLT